MPKSHLRDQARQNRHAYVDGKTDAYLAHLETQRLQHFLAHSAVASILQTSVPIGCYLSMGSEASTTLICQTLIQQGHTLCVPVVHKKAMAFVPITQETKVSKSDHGFFVPDTWTPDDIHYPDIVITPLLAFDNKGHRLGYGKGDFDHYFAHEHNHRQQPSLKVGWAYDCQYRDDLVIFDSDYALDMVVTDSSVHCFV